MSVAVLDKLEAFMQRVGVDTSVKKPTLFYGHDIKSLDVSPKGVVTGYLTVFNWPDDNTPYVDGYNDVVCDGMFDATFKQLDRTRRARGDSFLCPSLRDHNRNMLVGAVVDMGHDSKGYIYETQLALNLPLGRETFELAKHKMIWASYGYSPTKVSYKGNHRLLHAVDLSEQSFVTHPANALASVISTKHNTFTSYPSVKMSVQEAKAWHMLAPRTERGTSDVWSRLAPRENEDTTSMPDFIHRIRQGTR